MTTLLEYREKMKILLGKYDIYIFPVLKFILAFITFLVINANMGYMKALANPAVALILALLCSFLPMNVLPVLAALVVLCHCYALSVEVLGIAFVLIALMFLLFFRTAPQYGYLLVAVPLAFVLKIPCLVPLAMGLAGTPAAAIPVACGTVIYYFIHYVRLNTAMLGGEDTSSMTEKLSYLLDSLLNNKEMFLMVAAFTLTLVIVYVIRRLATDYSWTIAICVGAVADLVVILLGSVVMNISVSIIGLLIGSIVSAGLALLLQLCVFTLDYSRTEYVQFEDDEYYYYVKAVPKITIAMSEKKVKKITPQKKAPAKKRSTAAKKTASAARSAGDAPVRSASAAPARSAASGRSASGVTAQSAAGGAVRSTSGSAARPSAGSGTRPSAGGAARSSAGAGESQSRRH